MPCLLTIQNRRVKLQNERTTNSSMSMALNRKRRRFAVLPRLNLFYNGDCNTVYVPLLQDTGRSKRVMPFTMVRTFQHSPDEFHQKVAIRPESTNRFRKNARQVTNAAAVVKQIKETIAQWAKRDYWLL